LLKRAISIGGRLARHQPTWEEGRPSGNRDTERAESEQNLQAVRAAFDASLRGDELAMLELVDPSVVFTPLPDAPDVRSFHGHEGLVRGIDEFATGAWEDFSVEVRHMRDFDDHVLTAYRWRGCGKVSGMQMEADGYALVTLREGKIVRWQLFPSEQQALDAADSR
jgi:ketosteroid isomerase-like protein